MKSKIIEWKNHRVVFASMCQTDSLWQYHFVAHYDMETFERERGEKRDSSDELREMSLRGKKYHL